MPKNPREIPILTQSPFFKSFPVHGARQRNRQLAASGHVPPYTLPRGFWNNGLPPRPHPVTPQPPMPQRPFPAHITPPEPPPAAEDQAPPDPARTAEHFQRLNRGLPDGVKFEPLDAETQAALQALGKAPPPEAAKPSEPSKATRPPLETENPAPKAEPPPPEALSADADKSAGLLERLIQDEDNAGSFYRFLADIAPDEGIRQTLQDIVGDCEARGKHYQHILHTQHSRAFEPAAPKALPPDTAMPFAKGIEIALTEENKILQTMTHLLDHLSGEAAQATQNLFNKRLIHLHWLHRMVAKRG